MKQYPRTSIFVKCEAKVWRTVLTFGFHGPLYAGLGIIGTSHSPSSSSSQSEGCKHICSHIVIDVNIQCFKVHSQFQCTSKLEKVLIASPNHIKYSYIQELESEVTGFLQNPPS